MRRVSPCSEAGEGKSCCLTPAEVRWLLANNTRVHGDVLGEGAGTEEVTCKHDFITHRIEGHVGTNFLDDTRRVPANDERAVDLVLGIRVAKVSETLVVNGVRSHSFDLGDDIEAGGMSWLGNGDLREMLKIPNRLVGLYGEGFHEIRLDIHLPRFLWLLGCLLFSASVEQVMRGERWILLEFRSEPSMFLPERRRSPPGIIITASSRM